LFAGSVAAAQERVMFWNLENFFDYRNDSTSVSDAEFSSRGPKRWTRKRFNAKCNAVAKTILWAGGKKGGLPDVVGFAEVENGFVLRRLLQGTALRKTDYTMVHYDSPDPRGIDVALLYRRSRLKLLDARPCHLYEADSSVMATRDILMAHFTGPGGDLAVLVNHHPSKYGGAASEPRRKRAVDRLAALADSLLNTGVVRVVATGDFNDTPDAEAYSQLPLKNLALPFHRRGEGTIKYDGRWELIDLFFVSDSLVQSRMSILRVPFLLKDDGAGQKPLRTYSGPRYLGGVSDHCPVWLDVK
jgi:endonuclease/exonuclease/phosphatase family metal-dependent hydrolase